MAITVDHVQGKHMEKFISMSTCRHLQDIPLHNKNPLVPGETTATFGEGETLSAPGGKAMKFIACEASKLRILPGKIGA